MRPPFDKSSVGKFALLNEDSYSRLQYRRKQRGLSPLRSQRCIIKELVFLEGGIEVFVVIFKNQEGKNFTLHVSPDNLSLFSPKTNEEATFCLKEGVEEDGF